jgi:hypothetical protein
VWSYSRALAAVAASVVILTAGYILWAIQRVYLGAEYKGPHGEALTPITYREFSIAAPLLALAIWFGVYPQVVLDYMQPSVNRTVDSLADWSRANEPAKLKSQRSTASADNRRGSEGPFKIAANELPAVGLANGASLSSDSMITWNVRGRQLRSSPKNQNEELLGILSYPRSNVTETSAR